MQQSTNEVVQQSSVCLTWLRIKLQAVCNIADELTGTTSERPPKKFFLYEIDLLNRFFPSLSLERDAIHFVLPLVKL